MRVICASHLLLAVVTTAVLGTAPGDPPTKKGPRMAPLPTADVIPTPMPTVDAAVTLDAGVEFLIDDPVECVVASFPPDALRIRSRFVREGETLILPGKFIDLDKGMKVVEEEREFKGPVHVYRVSPNKSGECWLAVIEVGSKELVRRRIVCNVAPQPPPKPVDPDVPAPPRPVTSFHVVMVYESGQTLTQAQKNLLYGQDIRNYLDGATTPDAGTRGWRLRDKDVPVAGETEFQKSLWAAIRPKLTSVPCWAIEVNGKVEIVPLPATVAEGLALLKKYKGDK